MQVVQSALSGNAQAQQDMVPEKLCMLLLLQEPSAWAPAASWADATQHKQWQQLMDASAVSIMEGEVQYLREQLRHIHELHAQGNLTCEEAAAHDQGGSPCILAGGCSSHQEGACGGHSPCLGSSAGMVQQSTQHSQGQHVSRFGHACCG